MKKFKFPDANITQYNHPGVIRFFIKVLRSKSLLKFYKLVGVFAKISSRYFFLVVDDKLSVGLKLSQFTKDMIRIRTFFILRFQ